ncbi:phosphoribosyl-ATP diphosphatase [Candidatus Micrarchaeota archaeon]|nr:phosphoribosyl-ATP diphosphatase [Candidatus Micrarchaeota archaeon]
MDENAGLTPLIVQDGLTKQVLSLVYANKESVELMKKTGFVHRYSRQAGRQMRKGDSSGNFQKIISLSKDCDGDALLAVVEQQGTGACHAGGWSCFSVDRQASYGVLDELVKTIKDRKINPSGNSFVSSIISDNQKIGGKLREEAIELAQALAEKNDSEVVWEAADLLFFTLIALENRGIELERVLDELKRRRK